MKLNNKDKKIESALKGYTRFEVEVDGYKIFADYNSDWLSSCDVIHVEFRTIGANPISESGYRSHFLTGIPKDFGITKDNIQEKLQGLADSLAKEEKPLRAKKRRQEKIEANRKEKKEVEEYVKNQTTLF